MTRDQFIHLARTLTIQEFQDGRSICVNDCTKEQLFDVFWTASKHFGIETVSEMVNEIEKEVV